MRLSPVLLASLAALCTAVQAGVPEGVEAHTKLRYTDARKELAEPAEQGDAEAMTLMAEMLMRGQGGTRDELKARDYMFKAHEAGNTRATYNLGQMYLSGNLVNKDETKGIALVRQSADLHYPQAEAMMGSWIAGGRYGFTKDEAIALAWFQAAAAQNNAMAMGWLGSYYEEGKAGLTADKLVALDWYKKGGERGYAYALESAGRMYALGRGVSPDGAEALRWFKRAAATGYVSSYSWIGSVYDFGRGGVAKAPGLAYAWYAAVPANASEQDLKHAAEGKERVIKLLSPTELEEANKQSKTIVGQTIATELIARAASTPAAARKDVYGSGVVVSRAGDIVTNEHVVRGCQKIRIQPQGLDAKLVAKDPRNDLALLRVEGASLAAMKFRSGKGLRMGDELVVMGYPLPGILSSGAVVTTGIVNALTGVSDDTSGFQLSAAVQPGSSGGPIFDHNGLLVGIVRAMIPSNGPIPAQNINFGINLPTLSSFLDAHTVDYAAGGAASKPMSLVDITALAQKSTVQVQCN